jgi:hypothetical protein
VTGPVIQSGRDRQGRWHRTLEGAERDAQAVRMRTAGHSLQQISDYLEYGGTSNVHRAIKRVLAETVQEPAEELRQMELDRLDALAQRVWAVLEAQHVTVSNGRIVYLGSEPLADDAPVLNAVDRLVKISESRRKLLGLDAPAKVQSEGTVRYSIDGVNPEDLK